MIPIDYLDPEGERLEMTAEQQLEWAQEIAQIEYELEHERMRNWYEQFNQSIGDLS